MKRAVIVGINYTDNDDMKLYGCINDAVHIRNMLVDAYDIPLENSIMLVDDGTSEHIIPSKENILREINKVVAESTKSDELWFYYSGHGSLRLDQNQDERYGSDSVIVPVDYQQSGIITDDTLLITIKNVQCPLFLFFDSCHSGSVCDLPWSYEYNYIEDNMTITSNNATEISNPFIFMISGSRDTELSYDIKDTIIHHYYGAFTYALTECLRRRRHVVSWLILYKDIVSLLSHNDPIQIPILSTSSRDYLHTQIYNRICKIK